MDEEAGDISQAFDPVEPPRFRPAPRPAEFGETWSAARILARSDRSDAETQRLAEGYAPIVEALGLDVDQNPAGFSENGNFREPILKHSELLPRTSPFSRMADRPTQEALIAEAIRRRRQAEPNFLPGVPATVAGLRALFLEQEKQRRASAAATLARSQGASGTIASLGGGALETMMDPINAASLPLGGGGKTLLQVAAREALVGGIVETLQVPIVASNRAELGEELTVGEAAANIGLAAAGSGILGGGVFAGTKGAARAYDTTVEAVFNALPENLQRKWADSMTLDGRPLAELGRDLLGERMTPDERAAATVLETAAEISEASPFRPGMAGDDTHYANLSASIQDLLANRQPRDLEAPTIARGSELADDGATSSPAPVRAGATSTGARPIIRRGVPSSNPELKRKIGPAEAPHDRAKNPLSSAFGRYQFIKDTWKSLFLARFGRQGLSDDQIAARRADGELQEILMDDLINANRAALQRTGQAETDGNLYLLHWAGADKGIELLRADPSRPAIEILGRAVADANPGLVDGKSASEVIAWAHKKMGGQAAAVPLRPGIATGGAIEGDGGIAAIMRDEALELQRQALLASDNVPAMMLDRFRPGDLEVDAATFQFKSGGDEFGVSDRLQGVTEWNPIYAGRLVVWERADGRRFVADGHQRRGLAARIEAQSGAEIWLDAVTLREADGISAQEARTWAALKNIAEGTGSAVDAAKVVRDAGEDVLRDLPPKSALVRDGRALARLSDEAFGAVYNGVIPADIAAVVGHLVDDPKAHAGIVDLLVKLDPPNRGQAESVVRQAIAAGFHKAEQSELFGTRELVSSLFLERAKVLERGLARLRRMKLVYGTAAKEADTLERAGSRIARGATEREAQANAEAIEIISRLAFSRGPIADALNDAAARLAAGDQLAAVVSGFVDAVRGIDLRAAARGAGADDSGRLAPDGAGRGGDAAEADPDAPPQSGDPGEPSLAELEDAGQLGFLGDETAIAARFDDPAGAASKEQIASLEHDVRMDMAAEDRAPFAGTTVVDPEGNPLTVFHGTDQMFDRFERSEDIGFHFGDASAARARSSLADDGFGLTIAAELDIRNPLRMNDLHTWEPDEVLAELERLDILTADEVEAAGGDIIDREFVRDALAAKGYDGIVYRNETEGNADSYIVFDDAQIRRVNGLVDAERVVAGQRGAELDDLLERAAANQAELAALGRELAGETGVEFIDPGPKSRERAIAKLENEGYAEPGEMKDFARGGFTVTERGQGQAIVDALAARFQVHDKGWKVLASGYVDRKLVVRFPNGGAAEIQIVPKAIADYAKKGRGLELYQKARDPATSAEEFEAAVAEMKAGYAALLDGSPFSASAVSAPRSSSAPSKSALRASTAVPGVQALPSKTSASSGEATATNLSSSSKNRMDQSPVADSDMVTIDDAGKSFRLDLEGAERTTADIMDELDQDAAAVEAIRGCM